VKNYTSKVSPEQSVAEIETLLVRSGARGITKDYAQGEVVSITFLIETGELPVQIRLPANPSAVLAVLRKKVRNLTAHKLKQLEAQAKRTAWRLMLDWVQVQLSLIEMHQAEIRQVFMPYIVNAQGESLYQFLKAKQLPALGYSPAEPATHD
jgi:hypothetical protein